MISLFPRNAQGKYKLYECRELNNWGQGDMFEPILGFSLNRCTPILTPHAQSGHRYSNCSDLLMLSMMSFI